MEEIDFVTTLNRLMAEVKEKEFKKYLKKVIHSTNIKNFHKIRGTGVIRRWRLKVLRRDKYTCYKCRYIPWLDKNKPRRMCAHHMNNFNDYPLERAEVNNGITLCFPCHQKFHRIYGGKCIKDDVKTFLVH